MNKVMNAFMQEFKFYRQITELKDLASSANKYSVLDIQNVNCDNLNELKLKPITLNYVNDENFLTTNKHVMKNYGLKKLNEWQCFELEYVPGLLVIPNPFKNGYQRYFVKKTCVDYPNLPHKTNIDLHVKRNVGDNLWTNAIQKNEFNEFNKLRWVTIGYHYNWETKLYSKEDFTEMPVDVVNISVFVAKLLGYDNYRPEAGILNYYHLNSTLNAHQDRSELYMEAPLISISFGQPAIFLIGDSTKDTKPYALLIKSGDIVIMSKSSRNAYHGITRVLKEDDLNKLYFEYSSKVESAEDDDHDNEYIISDQEWQELYRYIGINRINYSIRQVYE